MNTRYRIISGLVLLLLSACTLVAGCCPRMHCPNNNTGGTTVQFTPFSGRFGYGLEGPYGFTGSLTKGALTDQSWVLEGDLTFPTAGYTVDGPKVQIAESYPEQVSITVTVTPPEPGAVVAQVITHAPVSVDIAASNEAKFTMEIVTSGK